MALWESRGAVMVVLGWQVLSSEMSAIVVRLDWVRVAIVVGLD